MTSVLDVLRGGATVAGAGYKGFAEDDANSVREALSRAKAQQDAERDKVLNTVALAGINPDVQGRIAGSRAQAEVGPHVQTAVGSAAGVAPIKVQEAADTAAAVSPITTRTAANTAAAVQPIESEWNQRTHRANRLTDLATEPPKVVGGIGPDGKPVFARVPTQGAATPIEGLTPKPTASGSLAAPMAAKVGQFGEMLKKYQDLTGSMDKLDVGLGNSTARDLSEHGLHVPLIGTIPGTKGLGNMMMNGTPEYSQYQAALSPFILAAAHALSGARINQDQVDQIRRSIELQPGDFANPNVRKQKEKNMVDLINSIGGSLPKDAVGEQEAQMDATALDALAKRGYRRTGGGVSPSGVVPSFEEWKKTHGH